MTGHTPWPPDPAAPMFGSNKWLPEGWPTGVKSKVFIDGEEVRVKPKPPKPPHKPDPRYKISLLVPFTPSDPHRVRVWNWLRQYWRHNLDDVEIVIGHDHGVQKGLPFSKTTAVNDAFRKSKGDVIVILDADAFLDADVIEHCAARIRLARRGGVKLWFVPYRRIYRLTQKATDFFLKMNPNRPVVVPSPPPPEWVEGTEGSMYGHKYGALCQIMPREAFSVLGGMDCRFRGWGGEDVSFMKAVDTLWAVHTNLDADVLHLWHAKLDVGEWEDPQGRWWDVRVWKNQEKSRANDALTQQYVKAYGNRVWMRELVDAGCRACRKARGFWWRVFHPFRRCG